MLGNKFRSLRKEKRLTLKDVSRDTGLSVSFLSKLETDKANASLGTFKLLSDYFDKPSTYFFEEIETPYGVVVRKGQGRKLRSPQTGFILELLAYDPNTKIEPLLTTLDPGMKSAHLYSHDGEEFNYIIKGKLKYFLGEEVFILEEGDSIYHRSTIQHGFENIGKGECVYITTITPPTF